MPPMNRKRPSPTKRRPAVAGVRTPGADRDTGSSEDTEYSATPARPSPGRSGSAVSLLKRPSPAESPVQRQRPKDVDRADAKRSRRFPLLPVSLGLAALMLVAAVVLAAVSFAHASKPVDSAASSNVAQIDAPATQQAGAAAVDILQKAYSYTYTTIDANLDAAVAVMTPEMGAKHRANFDTIRKTVTSAKTTTKAAVVADGVRLLSGDRAEVLAFVVVTGDNGGTALQPSGYRFTVSLLRDNGKWLLSDLTES